jgi:hypothetical protein
VFLIFEERILSWPYKPDRKKPVPLAGKRRTALRYPDKEKTGKILEYRVDGGRRTE